MTVKLWTAPQQMPPVPVTLLVLTVETAVKISLNTWDVTVRYLLSSIRDQLHNTPSEAMHTQLM